MLDFYYYNDFLLVLFMVLLFIFLFLVYFLNNYFCIFFGFLFKLFNNLYAGLFSFLFIFLFVYFPFSFIFFFSFILLFFCLSIFLFFEKFNLFVFFQSFIIFFRVFINYFLSLFISLSFNDFFIFFLFLFFDMFLLFIHSIVFILFISFFCSMFLDDCDFSPAYYKKYLNKKNIKKSNKLILKKNLKIIKSLNKDFKYSIKFCEGSYCLNKFLLSKVDSFNNNSNLDLFLEKVSLHNSFVKNKIKFTKLYWKKDCRIFVNVYDKALRIENKSFSNNFFTDNSIFYINVGSGKLSSFHILLNSSSEYFDFVFNSKRFYHFDNNFKKRLIFEIMFYLLLRGKLSYGNFCYITRRFFGFSNFTYYLILSCLITNKFSSILKRDLKCKINVQKLCKLNKKIGLKLFNSYFYYNVYRFSSLGLVSSYNFCWLENYFYFCEKVLFFKKISSKFKFYSYGKVCEFYKEFNWNYYKLFYDGSFRRVFSYKGRDFRKIQYKNKFNSYFKKINI